MGGSTLTAAVEGSGDEAVARRLAKVAGFDVTRVFVKNGKRNLDPKIPAYAKAAIHGPWLVLRDLDHDAACAPQLLARLGFVPLPSFLLRVPVRSVEAWLLADRPGAAAYFGVPISRVPARPDELARPKREWVNLARRSRQRQLRADIVPPEGSSGEVGPGYTARLVEYCQRRWDPVSAAEHSPSLRRALASLHRLRGSQHP